MLIFYFLGCKLLAMESSTVPLRHTDLQGNVKLPRRFAVPGSCETSTDRLEDLARAMTWVRQELVRVYGLKELYIVNEKFRGLMVYTHFLSY